MLCDSMHEGRSLLLIETQCETPVVAGFCGGASDNSGNNGDGSSSGNGNDNGDNTDNGGGAAASGAAAGTHYVVIEQLRWNLVTYSFAPAAVVADTHYVVTLSLSS